ncbi:hypothetical protein PanWU01x14_238380 [Parasponia andersonii]|uniref:Transposase (putative) gypsy type domain-containing protein n=1 Tax=Parasponia andersonii TaxID=3476 RepID=A0A2P5BHN3_PARAD|nr:hypothetical protein PanWU01x14_238380 [Parasponia andersonii]
MTVTLENDMDNGAFADTDYPESEPEIEITGARQSSPRIGDLPQDQWPRHIRDAPTFSSGYQYIEGNWSCTNVRTSCTANKLRKIASSYKIAIPLRLPMEFNRPHTPPRKLASFSEAVLKCGVHLPLHPYIKSIIDYYGVVPFQLTPNTYRYMVGLYILYHKLGLETPSPEEFAWFYQVKSNPSDFGFFYTSKWSNQAIKTIYGVRNNMGNWKNPFFHFDYAANGFFQNPDNRDRPGLSSDQLARVYAINELPVEEFNWKVLGTSKNLVACGLIPKGAAFPDPPVISSRPASSKKKPKKKSDLGASSSRIRKRKAPTTPPRSEPSSPETMSPPVFQPASQEEEMVIGSGLRAPPSTLGSMTKTKTPESTPPSKGKEKVDCSKKRKVVFEDVPASSPPSPPQTASTSVPPTEAATSSEPNLADKGDDLFALLNQLPEKAGMSAAFIDRFTSEEGWERMKRRSAKVAFGSAMRMLANTAAAAVLMHDPVLESLEKADKLDEITQAFENSEKAWEEEKANFLLEKQQMLEDLNKEKLAKENLEEKVRELERVASEYPDRMREATTEADFVKDLKLGYKKI